MHAADLTMSELRARVEYIFMRSRSNGERRKKLPGERSLREGSRAAGTRGPANDSDLKSVGSDAIPAPTLDTERIIPRGTRFEIRDVSVDFTYAINSRTKRFENSARREAAATAASVGFGGWLTAKTFLHIMHRIDTRAVPRTANAKM